MKKKIIKLSIVFLPIFVITALAFFLFKNSFSYSDTDLGWHLRIGEDIAATGKAPIVNYYNYTLADQNWVDHEWLFNLIMASVHKVGDFLALHIFFVVIILGAVILNWRRVRLLLGETAVVKYGSLVLLILGVWASTPHFGLRVQEFGVLMLILLLYIISLYPRTRRWLWSIPLFFVLWANMHGSFLLGLGILGIYTLYAIFQPIWGRWRYFKPFLGYLFSKRDKIALAAIFGLSVAATLINPYGFQLYAFLGGYTDTLYMSYIQEWLGQESLPFCYPQLIYLSLAAALMLLYFRKKRHEIKPLNLWEWGVSIFFFILAFKSRRHFPLFVFASLPLLTTAFSELFDGFQINLKPKSQQKLRLGIIILAIVFMVFQIINIPWRQDTINDFCEKKYPCQAVNYLKSRSDLAEKRLFNEYGWGGYLLYAYPERQIFIDGRMPQTKYGEQSILREFIKLRRVEENLEEFSDKHDIDLILLEVKDKPIMFHRWEKYLFGINDQDLNAPDKLRVEIEASDKWTLIYSDELSVIYERN